MAVRRESVRLDLEGNFLADIAAAAAGTAALRIELDRLGRIRINTNVNQSMQQIDRNARQADASINQLTGRLSLLADGLLVLGPGLVPLGAVGAQAIGGLAAAATSAAIAGGAAIVAFQGVGDALKAANEYAISPTTDNFIKMQEAMRLIGPEAQTFVREFQQFRPVFTEIRNASAAGLFPGLTDSLDDFERLAPTIARILNAASTEAGSIINDTAESLASDRWAPFLAFLEDEAPAATRSLSRIMGDLAHGAAEMWMAFDPGNDSFLAWAEGVADSFDKWASSSEGRDDIRAFLDYARESGPQVAELFSSLIGALAAITQAAAPLGGPVLAGLTAVARLVETVAESDMATPLLAAVAAMRLYGRVTTVATAAQARFNSTAAVAARPNITAANRATLNNVPAHLQAGLVGARPADLRAQASAQRAAMATTAGALAALGLVATGTSDKIGLTNTAMLTLVGTMAGPVGAGLGAVAGLTLDAAAANNDLTESIDRANAAIAAGDLTAGFDNLEAAKQELDEFKTRLDIGTWELPSLSDGLADIKNDIEGIFGSSDSEEADAAIRAAEDYYNAMKQIADLKPVSPVDGLNDLFNELGGEVAETTSLLYDFTDALARAEGFLTKRGAIVAYEAALDEVNAALKENGRTLDATTPKGRANIQVLDGIAASGLRLAENLRGANKTKFLDRLEGDVRRAARAFGLTGEPLDNFLSKLGLIDRRRVRPKLDLDDRNFTRRQRRAEADLNKLDDSEASPMANLLADPFNQSRARVAADLRRLDISKANPYIDANDDPFFTAMAGVRSNLASLDGDSATVYINTIKRTIFENLPGGMFSPDKSADGGTVPKTGQPYADRHPYLLADGEEVISNRNGQADRHRSLLKAINAGRLANGGTAGGDRGGDGPLSMDRNGRLQRDTARSLKEMQAALKATTEELENEKQQRQEMLSYRGEVAGSLAGDLTGNGLAGLDAGLSANKNDARAMTKALLTARRKGLDGPLFDLVAASGDLSLAQQLAALNRNQIREREKAYGSTRAAENALGSLAATEKFNETFASQAAVIEKLEKAVRRLRKDVREGTREGSRQGAREGARDRSRRVNAGARAGRG